jgi:hypothetical protein
MSAQSGILLLGKIRLRPGVKARPFFIRRDMKYILLLLLLISASAYAQVGGEVELGFMPIGLTSVVGSENYDGFYDLQEYIVFTYLHVYYDLSFLRVGGSIRTDMFDTQEFTFSPFLSTYDFYAELTYDDFTLGWRHRCVHPVVGDFRINPILLSAGYDEIYLNLSF